METETARRTEPLPAEFAARSSGSNMTLAFDDDLTPSPARRRLPLVIGFACLAAMAVVGARAQFVRVAPRSAVLFEAAGLPVNLTGLTLERVSAKEMADGERRVLVVEGDIVNSSDRDEVARPLSVSVRGDGNEPLYTWITRAPRQTVASGERAAFVARLASPPSSGASVIVEFERTDTKTAAAKKPATRARLQGSSTESQ